MFVFLRTGLFIALLSLFAGLLSACSDNQREHHAAHNSAQDSALQLVVHKTPTCGCCGDWQDHLTQSGITNSSELSNSLGEFKTELGIAPKYRSCHTGVSPEGFVFEGHVPAKYIKQFLAAPPENALGLTVPAMPVGSPGMEVDDGHGHTRFMPYQVLVLFKDGSSSVYADVPDYASQF